MDSTERRKSQFKFIKTKESVTVDDVVKFVNDKYKLYDIRNRIRQDLYLFCKFGLIEKIGETKVRGSVTFIYQALDKNYDDCMPKRGETTRLRELSEMAKREQINNNLKTLSPAISRMFGYL